MKVRVLAFAGVRDILGQPEIVVDLPDGASVASLRRELEKSYPELAPYWGRLAIAVDGQLGGEASTLHEGAEVALLPPVSGGLPSPANLTEEPIDIDALRGRVAARGRGAVLMFLGNVRDRHRGRRVTHLVYDAYRVMAESALDRITSELESTDEDLAVEIVHRLGEVQAGDTSVAIAVASPHREAAYRASREALERLKHEVPIWKQEHFADGDAAWREEEPLAEISDRSRATT